MGARAWLSHGRDLAIARAGGSGENGGGAGSSRVASAGLLREAGAGGQARRVRAALLPRRSRAGAASPELGDELAGRRSLQVRGHGGLSRGTCGRG